IAVGVEHTPDWNRPLRDVIADVHAQGGVAIAAHPVRSFWDEYEPVVQEIDGTELMHPIVYSETGPEDPWSWTHLEEFYRRATTMRSNLAAIGASDYHFFSPLGVTRTLVFATEASAAGILDAIRRGNTVVIHPSGERFGPAHLRELLDSSPHELGSWDYNYAGSGPMDVATRTLALAFLFGLLLLRRR
ncbi:MAG: hypothetical protein KC561_16420, partial [Myxococcales bacterium]|nr:hypothetical protein [Myxococcales bacterium]